MAVRRWGGTPRVLARTDESVSSSRPLTESHDTGQPDSEDGTIVPTGTPVKGDEGPPFVPPPRSREHRPLGARSSGRRSRLAMEAMRKYPATVHASSILRTLHHIRVRGVAKGLTVTWPYAPCIVSNDTKSFLGQREIRAC